jgi:hypothetical protein
MKYNNQLRQLRLLLAGLFLLPALVQAQEEKRNFIREYMTYYDSIQYFRYYDQRGINVFETPKNNVAYNGMRVRFGAGFTQQFQNLKHENNPNVVNGVDQNRLYPLGAGFNTAQANLNMDVQLADGIRLNLVTYLSARHHNEAWVKGGYIQFDKLPFRGQFWDQLMNVVTLKVGHMEINYGDAHFRRSDGGSTLYNPFMENYIVDAFTTEIGGEVYARAGAFFGMVGITNGEIKGNVYADTATEKDPNYKKSPAIFLKGGFDQNLSERTRIRVSGSFYNDNSSANNTLFWGDRTGSNYFMPLEKWGSSPTSQAWSGRVNPSFSDKTQALMLNGFAKFGGLEFFGTYENGSGRTRSETESRNFTQLAGDLVYRIGKAENLFVGARYNTVKAELPGFSNEVTIDRVSFAGGWFLTKNILLKGEYVVQNHKDYPSTSQYSGGKFNGYVIEAVVGF